MDPAFAHREPGVASGDWIGAVQLDSSGDERADERIEVIVVVDAPFDVRLWHVDHALQMIEKLGHVLLATFAPARLVPL